jgi:hypothetical protein
MARTLTRPMFRKGGMAQREEYMGGGIKTIRPKYMGGGMTGIMSGIVPDAGLTPRTGFQEGSDYTPTIKADERSALERFLGAPPSNETRKEAEERLYGYDNLGQTIDTTGRNIVGYSVDAAGNFVANPLINAFNFLTGTDFETSPYNTKQLLLDKATNTVRDKDGKIISTNQKPIEKKSKVKDEINPLDTTGGEKDIKDEESALMEAYKEYAPIFEKELGVSSDDTKKSLYLDLAKFGAGLLAQPGGDLVGAIGKAAEKPLEGAGETVKEQSAAKRQAKLLALQTAISEGKPGTIGKAIKDIAKVYKVSEEEAAKIYEKWNQNTSTAQAADTKAYRDFADKKNVNPTGFERNIKKLLASDDADLVGKFNTKLPVTKDGVADVDEIVDKEYYIGEGGELYRADKSTDPPRLLEPGEDGFKDSEKEE